MQTKNFVVFFVIVFIALFAAWQLSTQWGIFFTPERTAGISLLEFDKAFEAGKPVCYSLEISSNFSNEKIENYSVSVNDTIALRKEIDVSKTPLIKECLSAQLFSKGDNFVDIRMGTKRVFFHATGLETLETKTPSLSIRYLGNEQLKISITNFDNSKYAPVSILVNGKLGHRAYFSGSSFESTEKISLQNGSNEITVLFEGLEQKVSAEKALGFGMNPIIGLLIITALLCVLGFLVFFQQDFFERLSFSILSFFGILCIVFLALNFTGLLSAVNFCIAILVITVALALFFRQKIGKKDSVLETNLIQKICDMSPLLKVLICLVLFSSLIFNLFTPTYFGIWTSFYERQSRTIMETQSVPVIDPFSFLGTKPFGYMSGYFFVNPGISWLTGSLTQQSYAIIMLLSQLGFIASAILFFRSFGIGRKAYLGALAVMFGGFLFSDFSFNIRHVISYSFLFLSMFLMRKNKGPLAGIALGIGTFFQTPIFLMFIALLPVTLEKKTIGSAIKALVLGGIIALAFFAPTVIATGMPSQAESNVWGYMWSIPLYGFALDYAPVLALVALFILSPMLSRKIKFTRFSLWVLLFLIIYLAIQLTVSYRINIVATICFGLLISILFPIGYFRNKDTEFGLAAFFAGTFVFLFMIIIAFYPVIPSVSNPMVFVKDNSSTNANVLNEPYLGHPFIYFAERKSSADLAVEYAPEQMIDDSYAFLKESNQEILRKYNIDYVLNRSMYLDEKPVGDNSYKKLMEFEFLDKIYSNELLYVHWVDKTAFSP